MKVEAATQRLDPLLQPFLNAHESESEDALNKLITEYAVPIVGEVIRSKLSLSMNPFDQQEAEDLSNEAVLRVLTQLRKFKSHPEAIHIQHFKSQIRTIAYHTFCEYMREKHPLRSHLKYRLRYFLNHHERFALWEDEYKEWLCGLAEWRNRKERVRNPDLRKHFSDRELKHLQEAFMHSGHRDLDMGEMLETILRAAKGPVELDEFVNLIADRPREQLKQLDVQSQTVETLAAHTRPVDEELDQRRYFEKLWKEICLLPSRQRAVLLLHLKDHHGRGTLVFFTLLGIATLDQIADTLGMSASHFSELWKRLPLDDLSIGERLGITRQQVINLRKSARQRLLRRMRR
jgi:RNA polymerase sigma factor (sigma-70 family)